MQSATRRRAHWVALIGLTGAALLAPGAGAAGDFDPSAYRPGVFADLLDPPRGVAAPGPGGRLTTGFSEDLVRVEAAYTGRSRPAQTDPRLMEAWIAARAFKPGVVRAFPVEYEFTDGSRVAWVPIFLFVSPEATFFAREGHRPVAAGGRMELYVHRIALAGAGGAAVALGARAILAPAPAAAPPPKVVPPARFTRGALEFAVGGRSYRAPLRATSALDAQRGVLRLEYGEEASRTSSWGHVVVRSVNGPGTYRDPEFEVMLPLPSGHLSGIRGSRCVVMLDRLDDRGAAGTVACPERDTWTDIRFSAERD